MRNLFSKRQWVFIIIILVGISVTVVIAVSHHPAKKPIAKTVEVSNTLNESLPIQTSDYRIDYDYSPASKTYTYQITLYAIINRPSQYDSYVAQLKQFKQEALDYIKQHGGNPAALSLTYVPDAAQSL